MIGPMRGIRSIVAVAAGLALASCVSAESDRDKQAKDFWSFFETGEMGAESAPASPYETGRASSVPDLLAPAPVTPKDPGSAGAALADPGPITPVPINWYSEFGDQIMVRTELDATTGFETTYITKPYPMPLGRAQKVLDLMKFYGTFELVEVAAGATEGPPGPGTVEVTVLSDWDTENYGNLRSWPPQPMKSQAVGDRLVVTSEADLLYEVEDFVDLLHEPRFMKAWEPISFGMSSLRHRFADGQGHGGLVFVEDSDDWMWVEHPFEMMALRPEVYELLKPHIRQMAVAKDYSALARMVADHCEGAVEFSSERWEKFKTMAEDKVPELSAVIDGMLTTPADYYSIREAIALVADPAFQPSLDAWLRVHADSAQYALFFRDTQRERG